MKTLKINGEINIDDEMNLNDFCELFNRLQDENNFGFSGFIKDSESPTETFCQENK
jgi:hypothetical protein